MALLTQKQIKEILLIIENEVNVEWPDTMLEMLCEWNEKQTTQQIEIDWNDAPKYATKIALRMHWGTESEGSELWSPSFDSVTFERPAPVITPHPHAEIMSKYAEVAARRVDPWVEFEFKCEGQGWSYCSGFPRFHITFEYRHIGDNK